MRLTESMRIGSATAAQARASEQLYAATRRASTGMKVEASSDGPAAYSAIVGYDAAIARQRGRAEITGRAADTLAIADGALGHATDVVAKARDLAIQMANGDIDVAARARAAQEVHSLREELIGVANTKASDRYIFAGTADQTQPFTAAGAFVGNGGSIDVEISDGVVVTANASGAKAFTTAGGRDVLADLAALESALASNNVTSIQTSIDDLQASHGQVVAARSEAGLAAARLGASADMTMATLTKLESARAKEAEADPLEMYSALTLAKAAYERSIQVTAQILAVSSINR
jgi:flagellar hook-associated protein 3 FlgL